jgi:hypothetical protein
MHASRCPAGCHISLELRPCTSLPPTLTQNLYNDGRRALTYVVLEPRVLHRPLSCLARRSRRVSSLRCPRNLLSCGYHVAWLVRPLGGAGAGHCACGRVGLVPSGSFVYRHKCVVALIRDREPMPWRGLGERWLPGLVTVPTRIIRCLATAWKPNGQRCWDR